MRAHILMIPVLLTVAGTGFAQSVISPASKDAPPATIKAMTPKSQKTLDAYLQAWEERMAKIEGLETKIILTETEITQTGPFKLVFTGEAAIKKPNLGKMFLKLDDKPAENRRWKHHVADGKYIWDYSYAEKIVRLDKLPAEGLGDNTALAFLFGMKATDIKKRYELSIDVDDPTKFTDSYIFIDIMPKTKEDKQEFAKAQLVLWKDNKNPKFAERL